MERQEDESAFSAGEQMLQANHIQQGHDEGSTENNGEPNAKRRMVISSAASSFLSADELNNAKEKKWVDDWEFTFYKEQMSKEGMSEKQMEIKNRIDNKIKICGEQSGILDAAKAVGTITAWEYDFYCSNLGRENLSEKQQSIKNRIDSKLHGGAGLQGGGGGFGLGGVQGGVGTGAGTIPQQTQFGGVSQFPQQSQFAGGQFGSGGGSSSGGTGQAQFGLGFGHGQFGAAVQGGGVQNSFGGGSIGGNQQQFGQSSQQQFGQSVPASLGVAPVPPADCSTTANLLSNEQVNSAFDTRVISEWEHKFYTDIINKYQTMDIFQPTQKQQDWKGKIEIKIVGKALDHPHLQTGNVVGVNDMAGVGVNDNSRGGINEGFQEEEDSYSELWGFSKTDLLKAAQAGKITEWEVKFVESNFEREHFTERQQLVVDKIRAKVAAGGGSGGDQGPGGGDGGGGGAAPAQGFSQGWNMDISVVDDAFLSGKINDWEKDFITKNWSRQNFTEKQQPIVKRIQDKISGVGGGFGQQAAMNRGTNMNNFGGGATSTSASGEEGGNNPYVEGNPYMGGANNMGGNGGSLGDHGGGSQDDSWLKNANQNGVINNWELKFYKDNLGKSSLSVKQQEIKTKIDDKLRKGGFM